MCYGAVFTSIFTHEKTETKTEPGRKPRQNPRSKPRLKPRHFTLPSQNPSRDKRPGYIWDTNQAFILYFFAQAKTEPSQNPGLKPNQGRTWGCHFANRAAERETHSHKISCWNRTKTWWWALYRVMDVERARVLDDLDELERIANRGAIINIRSFLDRCDSTLLSCGSVYRQLDPEQQSIWNVIITALIELRDSVSLQRGRNQRLHTPPILPGDYGMRSYSQVPSIPPSFLL